MLIQNIMNYKPIVVVSLLLFLTLSCSNHKETITPTLRNTTESIYASGFIKSKNQYEVFGRTNGIVEKLFVKEGMSVNEGDPIFQLDNKNLQIATENARLSSVNANYKTNSNKLLDAKKEIELVQKRLTNDSMLYQRQKSLWSQRIGSKIEFEKTELNYENSKVSLLDARTKYEDLRRQLKLASEQSKNNLEIAKIMEDDNIIRSKIDGIVYQINKQEGELINGQESVAIIGSNEFLIELNIDEFDIVKVKIGQLVFVRMDSYQSQVFEAKISAIDPMMNKRTRSFQAEAIFTKRPDLLFPNLTLEANIVINTQQDVLTIPRNYLINDSSVMLKGGKVQKVKIGSMDYELVEIKNGIDKSTEIELPQ
jgi:HlyD family secretion protein